MRILLDTCTFLWAGNDSPKLSSTARDKLEDPGNEVYLSVVSAWEIAVKHQLGDLPLPENPDTFVPRLRNALGIQALGLDEEAALHLGRLPTIHRDPFDRILVCQAIVHGLVLLTPDELIARYPARSIW